eukprot:1195666-Prorocentrum_minimum.AAC.3
MQGRGPTLRMPLPSEDPLRGCSPPLPSACPPPYRLTGCKAGVLCCACPSPRRTPYADVHPLYRPRVRPLTVRVFAPLPSACPPPYRLIGCKAGDARPGSYAAHAHPLGGPLTRMFTPFTVRVFAPLPSACPPPYRLTGCKAGVLCCACPSPRRTRRRRTSARRGATRRPPGGGRGAAARERCWGATATSGETLIANWFSRRVYAAFPPAIGSRAAEGSGPQRLGLDADTVSPKESEGFGRSAPSRNCVRP